MFTNIPTHTLPPTDGKHIGKGYYHQSYYEQWPEVQVKKTLIAIFQAIFTKFGGKILFGILITNTRWSKAYINIWPLKTVIFHFWRHIHEIWWTGRVLMAHYKYHISKSVDQHLTVKNRYFSYLKPNSPNLADVWSSYGFL